LAKEINNRTEGIKYREEKAIGLRKRKEEEEKKLIN